MTDKLVGVMYSAGSLTILVGCLVLWACDPAGHAPADKSFSDDMQELIAGAHLRYAQDPSTSQCFAYGWAGTGHGGPIVTWVPCDSLPVEAPAKAPR